MSGETVIDSAILGSVGMASFAAEPRILRFGIFELDVRAGELRKRGAKVRLQGQPLSVLTALVQCAGDVVTREELRAQIWPADTFVDFDHSLHNAIARAREALGDSADKPRFIETLPRRGYRFIAPVEGINAEFPVRPGPVEVPKPSPAEIAPKSSRRFLPAAALILAFMLAGVWLAHSSARFTPAASSLHSLAVLPLNNFSGDPAEEFFADGMTDQLTTQLAQLSSIRVISRTSVMHYKGTKMTLPQIARELHVDAIVEGSVVRSGQRVRVTAQLVEASTDRHLWAKTYDRSQDDVLQLQGEIVEAIAQEVRAQISPQQQAQHRSAHVVDPAAYDAYLKGHLYFTTEYFKPDSLRKAQHLFQEAIAKDPQFALAYAGLADTYLYLSFAGELPKDEAYRSAKQALAKAQELDDNVGETHDILAVLSYKFDWDWDTAEREFQKSLALAPSYSCAHEDRAIFLAFVGRREEALAELANIEQLDYGYSAGATESATYYEMRDYPNLIAASKRALLSDPNDWSQHFNLGIGYEGTGKVQDAISEYQKALAMSGNVQSTIALAHAYSAAGRKPEASKMLHDVERKSKSAPLSLYAMATVYAGLGENDKAFALLDQAFADKSLELTWSIKADPTIDGLRRDPRYQSLLKRMGLKS